MEILKSWNQLTKPRVTVLVLATVLPGLYLGSTVTPSAYLLFFTLFGTFLMSSASFILNQYIERDRDALMERTSKRPIPQGKIDPNSALILGISLSIIAFAILYYFINLLTAICAFAALLSYVFLYTILLKPRTDQNIVIGGIAGCVGPLIGYAAAGNSLPLPAWILFSMIFMWTPPHFWALAIYLKNEYSKADFPMLPVVRGVKTTTYQIFAYTILYSAFCIWFYFSENRVGMIYLIPTIGLCITMTIFSIRLIQTQSEATAKKFFFFSIFHLFAVNILVLIGYAINT